MRRVRVRVGGPLSRLWLIPLPPVRLLSMARHAIGRRAARWFRVRRRFSIGAAAAAAEAPIGLALLGLRLVVIRLTALFATRTIPTAAAHIRSAAISTAALSLLGRHAATVRQSEAAAASVHQATSHRGGVERMRRPASGCGCRGQPQRTAGEGASAVPQQRMRAEHDARKRVAGAVANRRRWSAAGRGRRAGCNWQWQRLNRLRSRRLQAMTVTAAQMRRVESGE